VGSYDPDGSIVSYDWDFGDGQTSAAQNPAHAYAAAGNYTASLVVFDNLGLSGQTTVNVTVTPVGLPPPWLDIDVGTTGAAGSASYNGGAYTISGAGVGFLKDGIADNFNFAYQTLTNDGSITVRLNTLQNTGANARVGVVIRETLAPNSRSAFMGVTGASGFLWVSRANAGAKATVTTSGTGAAPNIWLRLVRLTDGTIEGYKSTNGTTWTKVKTLKVTTPQVYIGLAVSSGTSGVRNTSVFNSVTVVP
jgi:PKD repeat protein